MFWGPPRGLLHETRVGERVYAMEKLVGTVEKLEGTCGANLWGEPVGQTWAGAGQKKEEKRKESLFYSTFGAAVWAGASVRSTCEGERAGGIYV